MAKKRKQTDVNPFTNARTTRQSNKKHQTRALADKSGPQSRLLAVAPELRNRIYDYALLDPDTVVVTTALQQPALLRVNKQIRGEALELDYCTIYFDVAVADCDATLLAQFTQYLDGLHLTCAARIFMSMMVENWTNLVAWCKLIHEGKCDGLTSLDMDDTFNDSEAVMRAAHRTARTDRSWAACLKELAELRFLVGRIDKAWLL